MFRAKNPLVLTAQERIAAVRAALNPETLLDEEQWANQSQAKLSMAWLRHRLQQGKSGK